jgi:hypothetical protein
MFGTSWKTTDFPLCTMSNAQSPLNNPILAVSNGALSANPLWDRMFWFLLFYIAITVWTLFAIFSRIGGDRRM